MRRLQADYQEVRTKFDGDSQIDVIPIGAPFVEKYQVIYKVPSTRLNGDIVYIRDQTVVEFELPAAYPRVQPVVTTVDAVFHPNFELNMGGRGKVCIADFWSPAQTLAEIIAEVGEMLVWKKFNIRSPLNATAAEYGQSNSEQFPLAEFESSTNGFTVTVTPLEGDQAND